MAEDMLGKEYGMVCWPTSIKQLFAWNK